MLQNEIKPAAWSKKSRMRVWRWNASWKWRTCGRWDKWQNSRKSWWVRIWFEWGQTPLHKRLPKLKGFKNTRFRTEYECINVSSLNSFSWEISSKDLAEKGLISKETSLLKILWNWDLTAKLTVKANKVSKIAQEKIKKAWGKVELIS